MVRALNDSPYLYGLHDPGGERIMAERGVPGWVIFTEAIGSDPLEQRGVDYAPWANQGYGVIVRLNNGYEPAGTIPHSSRYGDFARRCGNFVRNSRGCHIWIIGNETNYAVERPGVQLDHAANPPRIVQGGEVITPSLYASCYRQCRSQIKAQAGHSSDQVIVAAPAPWNVHTTYSGNPNGDWIKYFTDILTLLGRANCDGMSIHAYTHGRDPEKIYTSTLMATPFQNRQFNFRVYRDFMNGIPKTMRDLPVYLTETDQDEAWHNANTGWVQRAYGEIDWWNRQPGNQVIRAVILYRWTKADKWGIEGKAGVIEDFKAAMTYKYNWERALAERPAATETPTPEPTDPIKFTETGKTARGLFAAFYRKYGADITGYPLTEEYLDTSTKLKTQDWQRVSMEEASGKIRLRAVGAETLQLRARVVGLAQDVATLQAEVARLKADSDAPAAPLITNIITQLPRTATGFIKRPLSAIKYLMIGHTGVAASVGPQQMAEAQRSKWPGIISQYFITADGKILQTEPVDEVVAKDQEWIYNGLIVYMAGNFDAASPPTAQLTALAQLLAWLLAEHRLSETAIKGVSEFIQTKSPGAQWLTGERWKDRLLAAVRAVPGAATAAELARLNAQVTALQAQLKDTQSRLAASEAQRIALQAQLDALLGAAGADRVQQPALTNIAPSLPVTPGALKKRQITTIKYVVINHTSVAATAPVETIAAAHQKKWGAITYHYFITPEGKILQTNALEDVTDLKQAPVAQGVSVALAGNFTNSAPKDALLKAAAALTAWLMQELNIPAENVKGAREWGGTASPGNQWTEGRNWKRTLLAEIAAVQQAAQADTRAPAQADTEVTRLQGIIEQLTSALERSQAQLAALRQSEDRLEAQLLAKATENLQLQEQVKTLEARLAQLAPQSPPDTKKVAPPTIVNIVDRLAKHATERYDTRALSRITHIAIHHSAGPGSLLPWGIAAYHVRKDWPGIGYHFYIAPDGTIWQTNRLETISFNVYSHNHYLVGICLAGRFMDGEQPPAKQRDALARLVAWLMQELKIPLVNVRGHKEFSNNQTACPGEEWQKGAVWKNDIMARIKAVIASG